MPSNGSGPGVGGRRLLLPCACGLALACLLAGWTHCGAGPLLPGGETPAAGSAAKTAESRQPGSSAASKEGARVALGTGSASTHTTLKPDLSARSTPPRTKPKVDDEPIARALRTITECQTRFEKVRDYTCTFYKREVVKGRLTPMFVMTMKARVNPKSIYFRFHEPYRGREAIYVEGRNAGKILAHDVGVTKFLAGTMEIEPTSSRAMEENRHPISDAGIGNLIDTVARRWAAELRPDESILLFDAEMAIGPRRCMMIESIHPRREASFQFHKVRLFIDSDLKLPIRFEGYDWPKEEGGSAELVEEYTYIDLRLNVGLGDMDFDVANRQYSFGRF
jgi:hypothetical protein